VERLSTPAGLASARHQVSRRGFVGGAAALAASTALGACSADRGLESVVLRAPPAEAAFRGLRDSGAEVVVAGEKLDTTLLRRFYERHDFVRVWATRPAQAEALANAVLRAGDHGLDPELFHGSLLRRRDSFPPLRRELLLTHAALTYAEALAFGAVPPDRRKSGEALTPDPLDVTEVLDAGIAGRDPVAAIEALAPATPVYRSLREALRRNRPGTPPARLRQIQVNLERQRWLPRALPPDRVWVNITDQSLTLYRAHQPVFATRVIVGEAVERKQSPEFRAVIEAGFFNPPWVVPRDIVEADILPRVSREPDYLERNNMVLRPNGEVEQRPGPEAGLGRVMFDMPNRFDVYLHDTPDKHLFDRDNRRISNGCIRVQHSLEFAALLMRQPVRSFEPVLATGHTTRRKLPAPIPVFLVYQTAFAGPRGTLEFRPDFYNRDADIWQQLQKRPPERSLQARADRPGAARTEG
jgi:murein L,D-transpeptidase YcbB/YkuD